MKSEQEIRDAIEAILSTCFVMSVRDEKTQFERSAMMKAALEWVIEGDEQASLVVSKTIELGRKASTLLNADQN